MAQYPRRQAQVAFLVDTMITGITEHPADFPHCDTAVLEAARSDFLNATNSLIAANAQVAQAAKVKKDKFLQLQASMKQQIKLAQVDCADRPVKLGYIGWSPRREAEPIEPPDQPQNLSLLKQVDNTITLSWQKPPRDPHRLASCYQVYRRQVSGSDSWELAGTALEDEITLKNQPTGKTEYRITALNRAGESMPSNTNTVVL